MTRFSSFLRLNSIHCMYLPYFIYPIHPSVDIWAAPTDKDCQMFSRKDGFIWGQQRIASKVCNHGEQMCKSQDGNGRAILSWRREGTWEELRKQRVHDFPLAESLPGKSLSPLSTGLCYHHTIVTASPSGLHNSIPNWGLLTFLSFP